jgi:Tetratricopeptide repeat
MSNYNRGTLALQKGKLDKALQFYKRETEEFKELYLNMGNAYRMLGNSDEAWKYYVKANSDTVYDLEGNTGIMYQALGNMGLICYERGEDILAEGYFKAALSINPLHVMAIWNYSLVLLRRYCSGGELHKYAWKMHEYRFKAVKPIDEMPLWDRKSHHARILVLAEQGLGDKLMYGRYLKELEKYCNEVIVQCPEMLDCVFPYRCVRNVGEIECEVGIPFGNLAEVFGNIPGDWLRRASASDGNFNVCVEWSGSKTHPNDRNRSCYAGYFPKVRFHNVRPDAPDIRGIIKHNTKTWDDSLSIIASCDLVISVDTSLVHAAGSLGIETWMMQPLKDTDFRWGQKLQKIANGMDIESNIWYSSVKVLDNPGWDKMFSIIEERLRSKIREREHLEMLGGLTVEQFVEKYASTIDNNRRNNDTVAIIND